MHKYSYTQFYAADTFWNNSQYQLLLVAKEPPYKDCAQGKKYSCDQLSDEFDTVSVLTTHVTNDVLEPIDAVIYRGVEEVTLHFYGFYGKLNWHQLYL